MSEKSDSTNPPVDVKIDEALIHQLPKVDLHCHLDGSLRVKTIIELAEQMHVPIPTRDPKALKAQLEAGENCQDLADYLKAFDVTVAVLQEKEGLRRAAFELAEDAANENVRYLEVRFSPILHTRSGLRTTEILDAVIQGLDEAEARFDILTGVIICGIRNINPETSLRLAELAVAYKGKKVVAFDLAGQEDNYPAKDHKDAFYLILKNNVNTTAHAGEAYGPESIHQAIHACGAHRIGHGTRLREDGDLLNYVNDHRIPLEICLTSNVQTKAVQDYSSHPLRLFYDYGIRVTINTDNRLMSGTTVTKEILLAAQYFDFSFDDICNLIINGFKSAFLPYRPRVALLNRVLEELKRFGFDPSYYETKATII